MTLIMVVANCLTLTSIRFMIYGSLIHAPLVYNWLRLAARLFPQQTVSHLLAKVVMDQTCFAPVGLSMFYIGLSALEGKSKEGIYKEWREKFPNTWAVSTLRGWRHQEYVVRAVQSVLFSSFHNIQIGALIWPILQAVNFTFVPGQLRAIYVAVFSFFWTTGLAALKHSDTGPAQSLSHFSSSVDNKKK